MTVSEFLSASGRRAILLASLAAVLSATSSVRAHPGQDPAKPAEVDPFKVTQNLPTLIIYQIKPDRAEDFQALWAGIRAGLAKSEKADVKAFADTLQPLRVQLPAAAAAQTAVFVFKLDAPSLTISYNPIQLLYYVDPAAFKREDADALYKKFDGSFQGYSIWPLK
jgi:hypothetical protein